ncbi:NADH-quinone oxidoreductase subunit NuoF [soil metagenome]
MTSVTDYLAGGGGAGLARACELGPGATIQEVALSGLRGRGGAGFPTGRKWQSVRDGAGDGDVFLAANGAEGEPGTFKDRTLLRTNPYQVVEGVAIAAFAVSAARSFIAVKASFAAEIAGLRRAIAEMVAAGLAGEVPMEVVEGPDAYLFGEETGLLEVIEGEAPLPRLFPPYIQGLFATAPTPGWSAPPTGLVPTEFDASNPTVVNNVETLAIVPHILARGPAWHRTLGTEGSPGVTLAKVVGDVVRPGVGEIELGTPLGHVIDAVGGGVRPGRRVKAVLSGVANPVLTGAQLDVPVSYEGMETAGSGMGSAGFIVYDDTTSMVEVARVLSRFLYVESCGQCPPCKLGTGEITALLEQVEAGTGGEAEVEQIGARLLSVTDGNRCYLPVQEQRVIGSLLRSFPEDFVAAMEGRPVAVRGLLTPKLTAIDADGAHYDERQAAKRPDWTYEPA